MKNNYSNEEMDRYFADPAYRNSRGRKIKIPERRTLIRASVYISVVLLVLGYGIYVISGLPSPQELANPKPDLATRIMSADGQVIGQFYLKRREVTNLHKIPHYVVTALISTEDRTFYSNWGLDPARILKAFFEDVIHLRVVQGASTIAQQLARNLYLNQSVTLTRKIREAITAVQLERAYTKHEILSMYLNDVYFGRGAYGIESAAEVYFDEPASQLTLPQAAMLIGMLRNPALFDPVTHLARARMIKDVVLHNMFQFGRLGRQEYDSALKEPLHLKYRNAGGGLASGFIEMVRQQLESWADKRGIDIYRDGLTVYTTLDSRMQAYADSAVSQHLRVYQKLFDARWNWNANSTILDSALEGAIKQSPAYKTASTAVEKNQVFHRFVSDPAFVDSVKKAEERIQVGFVCIDPKDGYIKALVASSNYKHFHYGLNHVTEIARQCGSAFKPFVYTVAIDNGYAPSYRLLNQPVTMIMPDGKRWSPRNADGQFGGEVTLRDALKYSINVVAVRAIQEIAPVQQVIDYAHRMGITTYIPPFASIAMGTSLVVPIQMASAYGVFADQGILTKPIAIVKIEDKNGNIIWQNHTVSTEVLSKQTAYIMTNMLESVINGGTGETVRKYFYLDCAGKTGTTNNFADAWFEGFTPQLVAGVWVGFDDQRVHFTNWYGQGADAAAPIWAIFMRDTYADRSIGLPISSFVQPQGVVTETICAQTGMLATQFCPDKETEIFNAKYLPPVCDVHTSPASGSSGLAEGKIGY